jgi:hypothetical protein
MSKTYKDLEELREACIDKELDISYGMNSNTLRYYDKDGYWEMVHSVSGVFEIYSDKQMIDVAKDFNLIKGEIA